MIDWIATHQLEFGLLLGSGITFILIMALHIVYILRTSNKNTTSSDLQQVKSIIENNYILDEKPKFKFIKGIEICDLNDEETDAKGNDE